MTAVKGVNTTKIDAGPSGDNAISQGYVNAEVEVATELYEASALATASTIDIAELPANAKVLAIVINHDDLGTAVTLAAGDSDDPDRYITAASVASLGQIDTMRVDGVQYVIGTNTGDSRVQLLTSGTITGTIKTAVYYTR